MFWSILKVLQVKTSYSSYTKINEKSQRDKVISIFTSMLICISHYALCPAISILSSYIFSVVVNCLCQRSFNVTSCNLFQGIQAPHDRFESCPISSLCCKRLDYPIGLKKCTFWTLRRFLKVAQMGSKMTDVAFATPVPITRENQL